VKRYLHDKLEDFTMWLAWLLPRRLVKWCYMRVCAEATTHPGARNMPLDTLTPALCLDIWSGLGNPPEFTK
jgi:hypothetical protein